MNRCKACGESFGLTHVCLPKNRKKFLTMAEGVTTDLDALKRQAARERIAEADIDRLIAWTGCAPFDFDARQREFLSRFAEAVAEECATVCENTVNPDDRACAIRERFGILPSQLLERAQKP
jgi:hypothetical protein